MIRHGVVGNISACHADARGSIPRVGAQKNKKKFLYIYYYILRHFGRVVKAAAC